jgi:hypothetical protein
MHLNGDVRDEATLLQRRPQPLHDPIVPHDLQHMRFVLLQQLNTVLRSYPLVLEHAEHLHYKYHAYLRVVVYQKLEVLVQHVLLQVAQLDVLNEILEVLVLRYELIIPCLRRSHQKTLGSRLFRLPLPPFRLRRLTWAAWTSLLLRRGLGPLSCLALVLLPYN